MSAVTRITILVTAAIVTSAAALAGPLTPPAGPVSPTMKTLHEVEPRIPIGPDTTPGDANNLYIIDQPGSYYLTGNIDVNTPINGVRIAAANVTLDLNGFEVNGNDVGLIGIDDVGGHSTTIRNGSINRWAERGIYALQRVNCVYEDLSINWMGEFAIWTGSQGVIRRCRFSNIGGDLFGYAVWGDQSVTVQESVFHNIMGRAIQLGDNATIVRNKFAFCITAVWTNIHAVVEDNRVYAITQIGGVGIRVSSWSVVRNNVVQDGADGATGIRLGLRGRATGNLVKFFQTGYSGTFDSNTAAYVADNIASDCVNGFSITSGQAVVVRNTAFNCTVGFSLGLSAHGPIVDTNGVITNENPQANFDF